MRILRHSQVSKKAKIGRGVEIGDFTIIYDNVVIGDGTKVGSHCILGHPAPELNREPLVIGEASVIRSHSVLYEGSTIGPGLETGHHVTIRERTVAGRNLRVGTLSDIQGDVEIGDYVRFHSNVHVGKLSKIGNFVWIFPYVVLTNDPTPPSNPSGHFGVQIGDFAVIATMACIAPGVSVGGDSLIAAMSMVTRDVPPGAVVRGNPARVVGTASDIRLRDGTDRPAYPWRSHFSRGYPGDVIDGWPQ